MLRRPNVLLITMDECKASALNCYGNGDAFTPNLDKLAQEGIRFNESYTTMPKCVPSRCAIITGRYPHVEGHRTLPGLEVRKEENNFITLLRNKGYKTAMFGKNHTVQPNELEYFFDEFTPGKEGLDVPWEKRAFEQDDDLFRAFYRGDFSNTTEMSDNFAMNRACDFINRQKEAEKPFFLMVNFNAPHPPYTDIKPFVDMVRERKIKLPKIEKLEEAPEILKAYREMYDLENLTEEQWRKVVEAYYGLTTYVDSCIGHIMTCLDSSGMKENTVVIVTSDHGDFAGEHGCVEKWDTIFYDCLIKVPLIIRCPSVTKAGTVSDSMIENVDIAPTIIKLCGFEVPSWIQGKEFTKVLLNPAKEHRDMVFCEGGVETSALEKSIHYDSDEHKMRHPNYYWKQKLMVDYPWTLYRAKMVRNKKWKLIYRVNGVKELYDIEKDPLEFHNVASKPKNKEIINSLMEELLKWTINTETNYPLIEKMYS